MYYYKPIKASAQVLNTIIHNSVCQVDYHGCKCSVTQLLKVIVSHWSPALVSSCITAEPDYNTVFVEAGI